MILSADSVQGVIFPIPGSTQEDALKLWDNIFTGDGPDGFNRNSSAPNLQSNANGSRDGFQVHIMAQVGRIDILLTPDPAKAAPSSTNPPRIDNVDSAVDILRIYLKKLIVKQPSLRLAIVVDMAATVQPGEVRQALQDLLGENCFPPDSSDMLLQYNVRRPFSASVGMEMNRLCTWSTGQVGFFQAQGPVVAMPSSMAMSTFVGLKIDVNTHAHSRITSSDLASQIIDEIADEIKAIRSQGRERLRIK